MSGCWRGDGTETQQGPLLQVGVEVSSPPPPALRTKAAVLGTVSTHLRAGDRQMRGALRQHLPGPVLPSAACGTVGRSDTVSCSRRMRLA